MHVQQGVHEESGSRDLLTALICKSFPAPVDTEEGQLKWMNMAGNGKQKNGAVKQAILSHTLVNSGGTAMALVTNAIILIWLIQDLGLAEFGAYALITALSLQFHLFEDSLGSWITRDISSSRSGGRLPLTHRLGPASTLYLLLGLPLLGLITLITTVGLLGQHPRIFLLVLCFGTAGFGACQVVSLNRKILEGCERFGVIKLVDAGGILVRLLGIALIRFVFPGADRLPAYALVFVLTVGLQGAFMMLATRSLLGAIKVASWREIRDVSRKATRFGLPIFGVSCTTLLSEKLDLWLVAILLSPEAVGLYGIALRVYGLVMQSIWVSNSFLLPLAVRVKMEFSPRKFRDFFLRATSLSILLTFGAATVVALNVKAILLAWFGGASLGAIPPILCLLLFAMTLSFRNVGQTVLLAEGRYSLLFMPTLVAALLNFAVSVWCTVFWGVVGPAAGTVVAGMFLLIWNLDRILEDIQVERTVFLNAVLPGVLVWALAAGVAVASLGIQSHRVWPLVACTLVYGVVHVLLFYAFILREADRSYLLGLFLSVFRARSKDVKADVRSQVDRTKTRALANICQDPSKREKAEFP